MKSRPLGAAPRRPAPLGMAWHLQLASVMFVSGVLAKLARAGGSPAELSLSRTARARGGDLSPPLASLALLGVALGAAVYFPALLFFALPLLFGVPHVAADLRYLVLRRDLPGSWRRSIWLGCAALLALRGVDALNLSSRVGGIETLLAVSWALLAVQAGAARDPAAARARVAVGLVLVAGMVALHYPRATRLALLHAHNVIALLAAGIVFRARSRSFSLAALGIAAVALLLASGVFFRVSLDASLALQARWLPAQLVEMADQVAPGLRGDHAIGVTSAFLFLQAVHYIIWLGVIPGRDGACERRVEPASGDRPQRAGGRLLLAFCSLRNDFGSWGLVAIAVASLAVLGAGSYEPRAARTLYLSLAGFHVYLELVMLLYFWVARGAPRPSGSGDPACLS